MAIELSTEVGRTLIYDGLAQNNIDMANYQLLNLDTSNLPPIGIPPSIIPPENQWLHAWDAPTQTWTSTRPRFIDIAEYLTRLQQENIFFLREVRTGVWNASPLAPSKVPPLDEIRPPTGNVSLAGHRLTGVANPIDPNDAVNLAYMDFLLQGLQPKEAVRCATTTEITLFFREGQMIDGVSVDEGDRVLVKNQHARHYENGIYIFPASGPWIRSTDSDNANELERAYCSVIEGNVNSGTSWVQIHDLTDPINAGDDILFVLFSSTPGANVEAGAGLTKSGNTLNVGGTTNRISVGADSVNISSSYAGQTSIDTLGIVTDGRWNADVVEGAYGGTGVNNFGRHITLIGDFSTEVSSLSESPEAVPGSPLTFGLLGVTDLHLPQLGTVATTDQEETFSNKRIQKRVASFTAFAKPAINTDTCDVYKLTAQDQEILSFTENLTGTPTDGQDLYIFIEEVHEIPPPPIPIVQAFPINWGDAWRDSPDMLLPTATVGDGGMFLWFVFNADHGKWFLVQKIESIAL